MGKNELQAECRKGLARLRFAIIGPLLVAPPGLGELRPALIALSSKTWHHPSSALELRFSVSTLERWYYTARRANDPIAALTDRVRNDLCRFPSLTPHVINSLITQYREHPEWTVQHHFDNLCTAFEGNNSYFTSYPTVRRYLKAHGMIRQRNVTPVAFEI